MKTSIVAFKTVKENLDTIKQFSHSKGLSVSAYVRMILTDALKKEGISLK